MSPTLDLPNGWELAAENTRYDSIMGRDYTTILYRHPETEQTVRVFEVLEPRANTWGYNVYSSGPAGDLGITTDLTDAKELAVAHMANSPAA